MIFTVKPGAPPLTPQAHVQGRDDLHILQGRRRQRGQVLGGGRPAGAGQEGVYLNFEF